MEYYIYYIYTYETFKISNCNADTKSFADEIGKYIQEIGDIIHICVDGNQYDYADGSEITKGEIFDICEKLGEYKEIELSVHTNISGGGLGFNKRFSGLFNDNLKDYVTYKEKVYYDIDAGADACVFDKDGLRYPDNFTEEVPDDVKTWFCLTPEIIISADDERDNQELYNSIKNKFDELKNYWESSNILDNWNKCGTIQLGLSILFDTKAIPEIVKILQSIKDEITEYNSGKSKLLICGIPAGENDYDFAIAKISCNPEVKAEFLKF